MSTPSPGKAPAPKSPPSPPNNATTPPPPAAAAPPLSPPPQAPPPATPTTPPQSPSTPPPSASPPPPETPSGTPPPPPVTPAKHPPSSGPSPSPPSTTPPPPPSGSPPSPPSTTPPPPSHSSPAFPPPPHRSGKSPPAPRPGGGSPTTPPSPPSSESGISTGLVVGIAAGGVLILAALSLIFICMRKRKRHHGPVDYYAPPGPKGDEYGNPPQQWQQNSQPPSDHNPAIPPKPSPSPQWPPHNSSGSSSNYSGSTNPLIPPSPGMALTMSKSTFTYEELERATDGFSDANLLGQGGFGYVHRGVLTGGKYVAIKQLKDGSGQGDREFRAEVEIISRVHHKHLVSLIGYCITGSQRLLVYEFVQNNTLEFHLHGTGRPPLEWHTRLKIALGAARGLAYLHEDCQPKIIHRDIKSSNILLDVNFEAKVADFGLAKFTSDANTHVSTRVMGTFGYLAPEYASSGKLTDKSDVFSFGVMLLELITGRKPFDSKQTFMDDGLLEWARPILIPALEEGNFDILVDPKLGKDYDRNEMARMVACVAACVRHSAKHRPKMAQVLRALEGDVSLSDLNEGITPGLSTAYSSYGSGSSDYDTNQYNDDMRKFRKIALGSQEYGSTGQYSNPTSEFGLNASGSSSEGRTTREMVSRPKKDSREV